MLGGADPSTSDPRDRDQTSVRDGVQRLAQLQQVTARLATALTVEEVSEILLELSERVLGASATVVYVDDGRGQFRLAGMRGIPQLDDRLMVLPLDAALPLVDAIRGVTPLWIENRELLLAHYPHVVNSSLPSDRLQSVVALPLVHGDRVAGGLALSFDRPQQFEAEDRRWLESLAAQSALAAERARLYAAERRARAEAETLLRIAESLNSTQLDLEALLQRVTDETTSLVGAAFGAFFYNVYDAQGGLYQLYALSGAPKQAFAGFGLPRATPLFAHTFDGCGVVRLDDVRQDPRYGQLAPHHGMPAGHLPVVSYLAVPVISAGGAVIGGLLFGHPQAGRFTEQHARMTKALAASAAVAIDNARLYQATREAEAQHRRVADRLAETVRLNELYTGVLAHDLRNPLSSVQMGARLALVAARESDSEALERPLHRVLNGAERMARMVDQLLDVSRIRLGTGLKLEPRPLDLVTLLERVLEELHDPGAECPIRLDHRGDASGAWDQDRLGQLFSNLVGNALQHGSPGAPVQVRVDGTHPDRVEVAVHNMGGIRPDMLTGLFDPRPVNGEGERPRDKSRGLGLGLFITRQIALAHGGQVDVRSNDGEGTTFLVCLPRVPSAG